MKYGLASTVFLAGISAASAQTTICNRIGNMVYCNTPQQQSGPTTQDYLRAMPNTAEQMKAGSDYVNSLYDRERQVRAQQLRRQVGGMVAAGQCDLARKTALNAGDFELATQVASMCQPPR